MSTADFKEHLLGELAARIDGDSEVEDRASLHNLLSAFFRRFQAEELQGRSVDSLYDCLTGLLGFIRQWPEDGLRVQIFSPGEDSYSWDERYTTLIVLCEGIPFCTSSVRGELNRRNLGIHTIVSSNLPTKRTPSGELMEVLPVDQEQSDSTALESLLFFEVSRQTRPEELGELHDTIVDILKEVSIVVRDFDAMSARLRDVARQIAQSDCVAQDIRNESIDFLHWLGDQHMILLGYEYLDVAPGTPFGRVTVKTDRSLGLLRHLATRGVQDLELDLSRLSAEELRVEQLSFSKSGKRSRVHRVAYPDYVEIREFDASGTVVGQHRFLGLHTSGVYTMDPELIPIVRRKVAHVMALSDQHWSEHESRELRRVLDSFPRDELFLSGTEELCATVNAVNAIQERRQTRLFVRRDVHGKFVNCLVYVPRDQYSTEQRNRIEAVLINVFQAEELEFTAFFSESILVRVQFVLRVDPSTPIEFDTAALEGEIVQALMAWPDRLANQLVKEFGVEQGEPLLRDFAEGFPPGYRDDFDPQTAVSDIRHFLGLDNGQSLALEFYRQGEGEDNLRLRLYHPDTSLPLSDVLPMLENLGLRVVTERPYAVRNRNGRVFWVQEFSLIYSLSHDIVLAEVKDEFEDAFARIWHGEAENDCFNKLLLGTQLDWREIALLRAYARYLRQLQFPYSVEYVAETLAAHLHITGTIVELFLTRFSPDFEGDEPSRQERELGIEQRILQALEQVPNLGQDRIFRQFVLSVKATLRTNFFQLDAEGARKPYFSFKLRPADIPDVPQPVPLYEIFVYSPRVEGVHLRGGKVARGGLRWSDRHEDFRTEVLGLVKAQQVKNAVIVPVGAKGGFVCRQMRAGMSRSETQQEGIACYELFIRALLDITDNRTQDGVSGPPQVVAKDDEDPYLVVAADKGTASFSDIANGIAAEYKFWLGDAFASGGSAGYDHKKMGITARGAWVSVQRHFREMDIDIQKTDFTVVGIGDMAGDVFGNGMLLSEHTCLVAAFNHQHIFIDPNPDAASSFAERSRLFQLPRSSWADYQADLISAGGGVFERSAKSIHLSPEARQRFDIEQTQITPNELISCLLRAPVDLLWNGGIGTYVKAADESHMQVGDKANDTLRVNGADLRCRVVGEGGNLGLTQLGRVEYCLSGGRCNTDFIDNAGGVDCSDHEVNIKILLNAVVARGELSLQDRNALLVEMTESVSELVLHNNYRQAQAISLVEYQAESRAAEYQRFITDFSDAGRLDRDLEFLPSDEELLERRAHGKTLTRPELSVLVSYSKAALKEQLIESELQHDACLKGALHQAFPPRLAELYPEEVKEHRLRKEIIATQIANDMVNRMGLNFVLRQQKATGVSVDDVACAYAAVMEIYSIPRLWDQIEGLGHTVTAGAQMDMMLVLVGLVKRATRWLLRNRRRQLAPTTLIAQFRSGVETLSVEFPALLRGRTAEHYESLREHYEEQGVDAELAMTVAGTHYSYRALGIVEAALQEGAQLMEVAKVYFAIGEELQLDWFAGQILFAKIDTEWQAMARDSYLEDLEWQQRTLATGALRYLEEDGNLLHCLQHWEAQEERLLSRWRQMLTELQAASAPDFAMLAVANRELLDLAQSTARGAVAQGG
ncbi:NAD-specific glutamate dehydrogenase [Halioglobus japonicus]|nr:NAD-specific glutamate dehydrogenase [Halioglobus japonicus]